MATSDSKENVFVFKCPVCLEKLKQPRNLPCLHSYCEMCIQSLIKSSAVEKQDRKSFECPVCRTEVLSKESNISVETWTSQFPLNNLILSLEDPGVDSFGKFKCDPCNRISETNIANYRCKECRENICEMCYTYLHSRLKGSNTHTVSDISEYAPSENIDVNETCSKHDNRDVEVYCFDHEISCCSMCSVTTHKMCQTVRTIDEIVSSDEENVDLDGLISLIDTMTTKTTLVKESTTKNLEPLEEKQTSITDMVSSHIDAIKEKLDQLRDQFQKKMTKTHFDEKQMLELICGNLSGFLTTLDDCKQLATAVAKRGNKKQKYLTMQNIKTRILNHMTKIVKITKGRGISNYVFKKDDTFYGTSAAIVQADTIGDVSTEFSESNIVKDLQKLFYAYLFKSLSNDIPETTFRHTFHNVSDMKLKTNQFSPIFKVRNVPWRINCEYRDKVRPSYVGVYLCCMLDVDGLDWACHAEVEFRIINHLFKKANDANELDHVFTPYSSGYGFPNFIEWDTLIDPEKGFVRDNKITVEVQVKAQVPTGLF